MKRIGCFLAAFLWLVLLAASTSAAAAAPVTGDIVFERKTKGFDEFVPAIFPHWVHRVKYKCYVCHNDTVGFKMKAGSIDITMDMIEEGKYCGACHKGRPAFAVSFETCNRCHRK